jgi:hypothetical protein
MLAFRSVTVQIQCRKERHFNCDQVDEAQWKDVGFPDQRLMVSVLKVCWG